MISNRKIIILIIFCVAVVGGLYVIFVIIPKQSAQQLYDGAKRIGDDFNKALQFTPEIKVNEKIIIQQQTEILELATLAQHFEHQYTWKNSWLGSLKEIKVTGTLEAKVGFDLNQTFSISLQDNKAIVQFPAPQLLSLENKADLRFEDEHGVWNWINNDNRSNAINEFTKSAKTFAQEGAFIEDARAVAENKILAILHPHADIIEITIGEITTIHDLHNKSSTPEHLQDK